MCRCAWIRSGGRKGGLRPDGEAERARGPTCQGCSAGGDEDGGEDPRGRRSVLEDEHPDEESDEGQAALEDDVHGQAEPP